MSPHAADPACGSAGGRAQGRQAGLGQRIDQQCCDPEHDDFAIGVKATEIDKDHVDDVGAAAAFVGIGEVEIGIGVRNASRSR